VSVSIFEDTKIRVTVVYERALNPQLDGDLFPSTEQTDAWGLAVTDDMDSRAKWCKSRFYSRRSNVRVPKTLPSFGRRGGLQLTCV
jgi:hypothetical protein